MGKLGNARFLPSTICIIMRNYRRCEYISWPLKNSQAVKGLINILWKYSILSLHWLYSFKLWRYDTILIIEYMTIGSVRDASRISPQWIHEGILYQDFPWLSLKRNNSRGYKTRLKNHYSAILYIAVKFSASHFLLKHWLIDYLKGICFSIALYNGNW